MVARTRSPRTAGAAALLAGALTLAACGGRNAGPAPAADGGLGERPAAEAPPADLPPPDLAPPDLAPPDLAPPDLAPPDLVPPDGPPGDGPGRGITFALRFISDVPESIWLDETDPSLPGSHWVTILRGGRAIGPVQRCDLCDCDADDCGNCPICGEACPTAIELPTDGRREWRWDGREWVPGTCPADPDERCQRALVAPDGAYVARFCWGLGFEGTPPCPAEVTGETCFEVPFTIPEPDGRVEHLVNFSGR